MNTRHPLLTPLPALAVLALLAGCQPAEKPAPDAAKPSGQTVYTCPMHPQVRQLEPGNCPLCGMTLVPETSVGKPVGDEPMPASDGAADGHDHSAMPPAESPAPAMPGMDKSESKSGKPAKDATIWTCSMHPQIRQDHPGNCPICGMKLVPLKDTDTSAKGSGLGPVVHLGQAQNTVAGIATTEANPVALTARTEVFGEMAADANRQTDFTWYYGGRVEKVLIDFNTEQVRAGQPILRVYSEEVLGVQEAYLAALRERWLRTFYEREVLTTKIGLIAAQLRQVGFDDKQLDALAEKKAVRTHFTITAPRAGALVSPPPKPGMAFTASDILFSVADLSRLWFVADVYEKDLGLLQPGTGIEISTPALPGRKLRGKLVYVDPKLDPMKRSVKARFAVDNSAGHLRPELSGTGYLLMNLGTVLAVPQTAVIDTGTRSLVYVDLGDAAYEQRAVTVGRIGLTPDPDAGQWVEIRSGLKSGDRVVTEGAFLIDAEAELQGLGAARGSGDGTPAPAPAHQH